ncbi:MAG: TetR/AcrR family transcriptional regulator [Fibromonadaceae bacterium]|jgi:AcrR family transcriptional regulator|nr:TetR/AcrR family transcriptional regulator [Fibromonadaceae bacterium]
MHEKGNVKQTILEKALDLFSVKGYEGVSVSELTEAAGITKPTLYYYFNSKEGLFDTVCRIYYDKLNKIVAENAEYKSKPKDYYEDIYHTLSKLTKAYFEFAHENKAFFRIMLANLSMPPSSAVYKIVEKYHFEQFDIIKSMFNKMSKGHGNLKGKSETLTWSFIGIINSYIALYFYGISGLKLDEKAVKELVQQFMHGIYS